ncbi:malate dehydrogenase (oxaloacetate-decarboxylating)(NADP+) [Paracoccus isoporae]|uniref:Malate dehydrogenase (Oxaloacetate-decarboxylating)(NADP+) n=1 Tax=Paracoccus isoporae TaxID=591205 RepID=A0A1G6X1X9_9RHOB|nr:NADP-dependent malic enzyme [Paracoccus isoporae]SDD71295.1 malate dehydrogenase (oxaloacetate-decarboxylating)(NADP+) [Paracoccus isoporae]
MSDEEISRDRRQEALDYHEFPKPGKLEIRATKPMDTGRDLSNAYSPGVAEACLDIQKNPLDAMRYTAKSNLVAVMSNGTAVLGLGNIGAQASKPVMEGKAVLFKKFAGVDCFDIEVDETDPEKLAEIVCKLEPTFGAVNLEDIKAPDCFLVERICRERMNIPVFHDDQHGTAIVAAAAATNALRIADKRFEDLRVVALGAGAAGIACLKMLMVMGVQKQNITMLDSKGVVHAGRDDLNPEKQEFARDTEMRSTLDAMEGADLFLGVSGPGLLTAEMVAKMAERPIIFALANPTPEIMPEEARRAAPDALIATGRSDYPNQVNNVLCFPFIFRGALDAGATSINDEMKVACVEAIAALARETTSAEVGQAYRGETLSFGPDYLIPKPFDPRLLPTIATAVARAAIDSGVATRELDLEEYDRRLRGRVYRSYNIMRSVFEADRITQRRIVFAEGEDERILHAARQLIEEGHDTPILIGRPEVISQRLERDGIKLDLDAIEVINPESDARYRDYWTDYHQLMRRRGVTPDLARAILRTNTTVIAAMMVHRGEADSMICGTFGEYRWHLRYVTEILARGAARPVGALSLIIMEKGPLFLADTQVHLNPDPAQIAETVVGAARHMRRFGVEPRIALCSASQFGNLDSPTSRSMRAAMEILDSMKLDFEYEGEMPADVALDPELRERLYPDGRLTGKANGLVYANAEIANAARNMLRSVAGGLEVGPILMGMENRAHIVTPGITVRGLINIAALAGANVSSYS